MTLSKVTNILIIGLGVIGGSYAEALTEKGYTVRCITKEESDVKYAIDKGIIASGTTEIDKKLISDSDLVIFALYPTIFIDWIKKYGTLFSSGTIITDVSGVKSGVVEQIQEMLPVGVEFISAHPMAGREQSGIAFSDPSVFKGANYIVTPTEKNSKEAIEVCKELGRVLGFKRISLLSVSEHDKMIAFLSQLTHCIAVCLMNCNMAPNLEKFTGDSFRDLTRIAKINDRMWSELFLMNKDALIESIDGFINEISSFRDLIINDERDTIREKMRSSTARRVLFDKPKN